MNRQKSNGFLFLIFGIIVAVLICFFNLYEYTNRLDLISKVPGADIYNKYQLLCMLCIGIFLCFGLVLLCIGVRFQQDISICIQYVLLSCVAAGFMKYSLSTYYHTEKYFFETPEQYAFHIANLFLLSLITYLIFQASKWVHVLSCTVHGVFLAAALFFVLFKKYLPESVLPYWSIICEVYQFISIAGLLLSAILWVKKDLDYSKPVLAAYVVLTCYLPTRFAYKFFQPCYLSFYQVAFIIAYLILGFTILNLIISDYEDEEHYQYLETETEKNFVHRRTHYETFARQMDALESMTDFTFTPILPVEAILLDYAKKMKPEKIDFTAKIDVPRDVRIKHGELCLVLANLLDNAFEACEKMETGKKYIRLEAYMVEHMMMLELYNSYDGKPLVSCGDLYYTSKEYAIKGMGLTTAKDIATRYNGSLSIQAKTDVPEPYFVTQLFFPEVAPRR